MMKIAQYVSQGSLTVGSTQASLKPHSGESKLNYEVYLCVFIYLYLFTLATPGHYKSYTHR